MMMVNICWVSIYCVIGSVLGILYVLIYWIFRVVREVGINYVFVL